MSGRPSRKSAEIGPFRPFSAFFALFRSVRRAPGKSRKRRKKAFFLRYPQICLNPHLLNPHLRHSNSIEPSRRFSIEPLKRSYRTPFSAPQRFYRTLVRVQNHRQRSIEPFASNPLFLGHPLKHFPRTRELKMRTNFFGSEKTHKEKNT